MTALEVEKPRVLLSWRSPGTVYIVRKGGHTTTIDRCSLEQTRLMAEIHRKNGGEPALFRFFSKETSRFVLAWFVHENYMGEWLDVSIPKEVW